MPTPVEKVRQYSVRAANRTLPLVRMIVSDIVELHRDVSERRDRLSRLLQRRRQQPVRPDDIYAEELREVERVLEQDEQRYRGYLDELHELGVELTDPVVGQVDFPTSIDGRPAFLSWKLGEPEVTHWHSADEAADHLHPLDQQVFAEEEPWSPGAPAPPAG
ncbi:MAG: hypothetical protein KatS3mg113_1086 [Planctomycetaceae bacterium]|nr:MAG: hypothetical protein KatS3mg113_1086 [Planctomycetaceae bacterium]